jgi:ketose-bisphosphate aldolase
MCYYFLEEKKDMKTTLKKELEKAFAGKYAIPAFNFDNYEIARGIINAAEEENSPVILMVTESAAKYMGIDYVYNIGKFIVETSKVPVVLHWDHGFDIELVKKACENGFTSVMLDASKETVEDNIRMTKEVVETARKFGVDVESEIGHVGGKEDDRDSKGGGYTTVEEAVNFETQTGIDALAIAVGTAHGIYKGKPELQFDLIKDIKAATKTPLVLHGSSGVPLEDLQEAIKLGITKINIGTDLKLAYAEGLQEWFKQNEGGFDARKFGTFAIEKVKAEAIKKIRAMGSNGKA